MQKYYSGASVIVRGRPSREVERCIWTDGNKYYIKWYGEYAEVENTYGIAKVTAGWHTVHEWL